MTSVIQPVPASVFRKGSTTILALVWSLGILSGIFCFHSAGSVFSPLMRGVLCGSVSIVGLMLSYLLPFLFSAFAVLISQPWLLFPLGFFRAFLLGFVSMGLIVSFGSAGWLLRLLLMFGDLLSGPLLYWYMYRHLSPASRFSFGEFLAVLSVCVLIGSIDYGYILPFLAGMINS